MRIVGLAATMVALAAPQWGMAQDSASAVPAASSASLSDRAAQLPDAITGKIDYPSYFTPEFLAAVPPAQLKLVTAGLVAQYGAVQGIDRVEPRDAVRAAVYVRFERAVGRFDMTIDPGQSGRVAGLLATSFAANDESLAAIADAVRALPGRTNLLVTELGTPATVPLLAHNADSALAIGSTFKLYILAELAAQVQRRKLGWDRVTDVDRRSFSSKATEFWPEKSPVTLHTLASWMISVSDNGATDMLLDVLGRDAVGKRLTRIGNSVAARNLPFLNTVEAFALKSSANTAVRAQFLAASEAEQRRLIDTAADQLTINAITGEMFIGKPLHIDTIEWFASATDLARLMNQFRSEGMADARAIMAINPGIPRDTAANWAYLGYKGGSEAGVISMSFLTKSKAGRWYAVTGSWNNVAAPVDNDQFASLMQRLVAQLAKDVAEAP